MRGIRRYESGRNHGVDFDSGRGAFREEAWQETLAACPGDRDMTETLKSTIESEIIPKLVLAHRVQDWKSATPAKEGWRPAPGLIEEMTQIVLDCDDRKLLEHVGWLRADGASMEDVYLKVLTPVAHRLGDLWVEDKCHFVDVTVGLARVQALLRELSSDFGADGDLAVHGGTALLAVDGEEQHTCGILMVAEFFRRDGWSVWCGAPKVEDEVCDLVSKDWFNVVGFSLSRDALGPSLKEQIARVRRASKNPNVPVFVGGRVFIENPSLIGDVGADVFAEDGVDAVVRARKHLVFDALKC